MYTYHANVQSKFCRANLRTKKICSHTFSCISYSFLLFSICTTSFVILCTKYGIPKASNQLFPRNQLLAILPGTTYESRQAPEQTVATRLKQEGKIEAFFPKIVTTMHYTMSLERRLVT